MNNSAYNYQSKYQNEQFNNNNGRASAMSQMNNTKGTKFNMSMTSMNMSKSKLYNESTKEKYIHTDHQEIVGVHAEAFKNDLDFQLDHFETIRLSYITQSKKVKDT